MPAAVARRFALRAFLTALVLTIPLTFQPARAAVLNAGDIIVTGSDAFAVDYLVRVDPATGARTVISSGGLLHSPQGLAIDATGQIIVADSFNGLIRVDPVTGAQTLISSGGLLSAPFAVAVESTGQLIATNPATPDAVIRVDPVTGAQTSLSADGLLQGPTDVVIDASGQIVVSDGSELEEVGRVVRVDPVTGAQTLVRDGLSWSRKGIEVDDAGQIVVMSSGDLLRLDPVTGLETVISSGGLLWQAPGAAIEADGKIIVAESLAGIVRVDPVTGVQTLLSPRGGSLELVWGVAVALPDLVQTAVSNPPLTALLGDVFAVTDTVRNQGSVGAGASTTRYYLSLDTAAGIGDILLGARAVPALGGGATSTAGVAVSVGDKTPPGTYYLLACADADRVVAERWNSNNCRTSTGQIDVRAPDLVLVTVNNPPPVALVGGTFLAGDRVVNRGNLTAGISSTRYYLSLDQSKNSSDRPLTGTRALPALAPGAASEDTIMVRVPSVAAGSYHVIACADDTARVAESNEDNNCRASSGRVKVAGADLVVTSISNPPVTAGRGTTFSVTATVRNQGSVAAAPSTMRLYLSIDPMFGSGDVLLTGSRAVPGLNASATSTGATVVGVPATTPGGSYHVLACADDARVVAETNEANNCRASESRVIIPVVNQVTPPTFAALADERPRVHFPWRASGRSMSPCVIRPARPGGRSRDS